MRSAIAKHHQGLPLALTLISGLALVLTLTHPSPNPTLSEGQEDGTLNGDVGPVISNSLTVTNHVLGYESQTLALFIPVALDRPSP